MFRFKLNRIVAGILLAYFALFIVPPVSSFASPVHTFGTSDRTSGFQSCDPQQAACFLFDIILWQQFKKTKQSEFQETVNDDLFNSNASTGTTEDFQTATGANASFPGLMDVGRHVVSSHRSRSSAIRFSRSGSSPPAPLS